MKLKSRKIISMALVFFMMLTILPLAPATAHAASGTLAWETASDGDCYVKWDADEFASGAFVHVNIKKDGTQLEGSDGYFTTHVYDNKLNVSQQIRNGGSGSYVVEISRGEKTIESSAKNITFANKLANPVPVYDAENVSVSWGAVSGAAHYRIGVYVDGGMTIIPEEAVSGTSFDLSEYIAAAGSYNIYIKAISNNNSCASSDEVKLTITKESTVPPVTGLAASGKIVTWDVFPGANKYWVMVRKDGFQVNDGWTTDTSFDLTTGYMLTEGTYVIEVTAYNNSAQISETGTLTYYYDPDAVVTPPATQYTVAVSASPVAGGTVTQTGTGTYDEGAAVTVTATANADYEFVEWQENSTKVSEEKNFSFIVENNRNLVAVFKAKEVTPPSVITELNATVTEPSIGAAPATTATTTGTDYTVSVSWWLEDATAFDETSFDGVFTGTSFEENVAYGVAIKFTAEEGKTIASEPTVTINGKTAHLLSYSLDGTAVMYYVKFDKLVDTVIDELNATVTEPAIGAAPATTATTTGTDYTVSVSWWLEDATAFDETSFDGVFTGTSFEKNVAYGVAIKFTAEEGKTIASEPTVTINGKTAHLLSYSLDGTAVMYYVKFDKLEATKYDITVNGGTASASKATAGTEITLTVDESAIPAGKVFDKWEVVSGDVTVTDGKFTMPEKAVEIKATYKSKPSSGSGSGGGFSGSYNYPVNADKVTGADVTLSDEHATAGETVTITVKPEAGKKVDEVIVTDADGDVIPVTKAGDNQYTFTMPAGKVNVEVTTENADYSQRIVMQINNRNILDNGKTKVNDVAPVIVGDRTLVPIRVVTELLGGSADWDNATRTVTLKIDGKTMNMTIGKPIPGFGTSAVIMNDRTYVPVRYVMEKLGAEVEWINATRQIIIEK